MQERLHEENAQATVEAAVLLPTFLVLLLLTLQPVCILYTRSVMESAAAETARLMVTAEDDGESESYEAFALRRLAAVPDVAIFHAGGPLSWEISCTPAGDADGGVSVAITGYVQPLPVLGTFVQVMGTTNAQGDVELSVTASYCGRPEWLEGSYETWTSRWD